MVCKKSRIMLLFTTAVFCVSGYFHMISAEEDLFTVVTKNDDNEEISSYIPDEEFGESKQSELKISSTHEDERVNIEESSDDDLSSGNFDQVLLSTDFPTLKVKSGHEFLLYGPANVDFTTLYGKVLNSEYTSNCNKESCKYTFIVKYAPRQRYEKLFYNYKDGEGAFHIWVAN